MSDNLISLNHDRECTSSENQREFLFQKKSQVSTRLSGKSLKTDRNKWGGNVFNIYLELSVQRND